ncbi:MAG: ATP-grasp domain-containing protein [Bacteroidota bacterium]
MTVALVYNVKAEAPPQSSLTASQVSTSSSDSASQRSGDGRSLTISVPGSSDRANDMYIEWDTMETVNAVRAAIAERHNVLMIEADEEAYQKLLQNRPDFAFNIAEGLYGVSREAQMPAILEMLRIPYLGSDPLTLAVCLDKARAKEILSYYEVPTAPFSVIRSMGEFEDARVKFPAMVKPLHEGSSKGIYNSCVVRNTEQLEREVQIVLTTYNQPALIEEFLPGREFTVALLGNGDNVRTLPIVEIRLDALPPGVNPIYSYEAKWIWDTTEEPLEIFQCPADLDENLQVEIETICKDAYRVLNCRDWSRVDVRLDATGRPHILEINPLPGILPKPEDNSCFPKAARAAGMSYNQLINSVLDIGMERCGLRVRQETSVGQAEVMV